MNPTRLFVLGALAKHGPMYGHQLRRDARLDRADMWSDVRPGSLYGALHRLAAEGLIEPVRTEQAGNLPARTVYAITAEGQRELRALRAEALAEVGLRPDPVDLALAMSSDLDEDTLRGYVEDRIGALTAAAARFDHRRDRVWPDQTVADDLVVEHARLRIEAELSWHRLVLGRIGKLTADSRYRSAAEDLPGRAEAAAGRAVNAGARRRAEAARAQGPPGTGGEGAKARASGAHGELAGPRPIR